METNESKHRSRWTDEEREFLYDNWGLRTIKYIASKLNRKESAILRQVSVMQLGGAYQNGMFIHAKELSKMFKCDNRVIKRWIREGLTCNRTTLLNETRYLIKLTTLLKWLKENPNKWDSRNLEFNALGTEENWLKEKRRHDFENIPTKKYKPYSKEEDNKIINYYKLGYTIKEIATRVNRTPSALEKRISNLRKQNNLIQYKNPSNQTKKNIINGYTT